MPRSEKTFPPRKRRLSPNARRALLLLANTQHGAAEELLMLAHGFRPEMLAGFVLAGLATVVTETVQTGISTIKVERYRITDAGRKALQE